MPIVTCVIIHFGKEKYLQECRTSLKKAKKEDFKTEIIVVDNNKNNLGFAGGANRGIEQALKNKNSDYIFLLNNDTIIDKQALIQLLETAKPAKIGIIGPKILSFQGEIESLGGLLDKNRFSTYHLITLLQSRVIDSYVRVSYTTYHSFPILQSMGNERKNIDFIPGTAMLIKREVFEKIGFFDKRFFLYYEDVDFCLRAQKAGFKIALNPQAIVYHCQSAGRGLNSPLKQYYLARNHLLLMEKHAPLLIKLRELLRLPKTLFEHFQKGEKNALLGLRDYFLRRFARKTTKHHIS